MPHTLSITKPVENNTNITSRVTNSPGRVNSTTACYSNLLVTDLEFTELEPVMPHSLSIAKSVGTPNITDEMDSSICAPNASLPLLNPEKDSTYVENSIGHSDIMALRPSSPENITELPCFSPRHQVIPSSDMKDFSSGSSDLWEPPHTRRETVYNFDTDASSVEAESSDDNIPLAQLAIRKRKKGQGPMQRKLRKHRTECRTKGEAYVTAKGKDISARKPLPLPHICRARCAEKTRGTNLNALFKDYRNLPCRDTQKRYLASLITVKPKERTRRSTFAKNREVTVLYKLECVEGNICKTCFLKVFGETRGFLDDVIKKKGKSSTSIIQETDLRRGHHPGNKRSEADITFARDFINTIPAYESHYSRRHTNKRYLEPNMNLQLYILYKEKFVHARSNPVDRPLSLSVFRNVFKGLNLKFRKPSNDTCKTCDSLSLKVKTCISQEQKLRLENELKQHQDKASLHYEIKRSDKRLSRESLGKIMVAAFDLQKCLPTPNLKASISFYKRKLWTFNLTVRNITTKRTSCYVWHEGVAQRGADEIASCLFQFIKDLPVHVERLILYSDTCPGQNRNSILPVMFKLALQRKTTLKEIDHKFLVSGHTHLECDTNHAAIERFVKNRNSTISIPQDWVSAIKLTSNRHDVKFMKQTDFFAFSKVLNVNFIKRNIAKDKTSFEWNSIFWLRYKRDSDVGFKYTLNSEEPFRFYSMQKRGKSVPMANIQLPVAYTAPVPIEVLKYKDIQDLLPYIDPIYHDFYKKLKHTQSETTECMTDSDEEFND